jgi:hypothetical protein
VGQQLPHAPAPARTVTAPWRRLRRRLAGTVAVGTLAVALLVQAAPAASGGAPPLRSESVASAVRVVDLAAMVNELDATMPRRGSEGYVAPSRSEAAALASSYRALAAGDVATARSRAQAVGYRVELVSDRATGRRLSVLSEPRSSDGRYRRAWGLFVVDPLAAKDVVVEVAHPVADVGTSQLGVALFRRTTARALFVAGAHRAANADGSSDVAHAAGSAFQAVHSAATSARTLVVQPHGFDHGQHPTVGAAVVSSGTARPTGKARAVAGALRARGLTLCLYPVDCNELGGTTNVQGAAARAVGAEFLHLELSRALRSPEGAATTATAVARGLAS